MTWLSEWTCFLRTFLILGRVSNLPTVWSNCLAAWWLGGGGSWERFFWLCAGATLVYLGGMFLNDAFDEEFDRQHRPERPIPAGDIGTPEVWMMGGALLSCGMVCLLFLGKTTAVLAVFLVLLVLIYDAVHKIIHIAPVLMAGCRFFLFLVAASAAVEGVTGLAIWTAYALAAYIIGLSYIARKESGRGPLPYWPAYLLACPIVLSLLTNDGDYLWRAIILSLLLGSWIIRSLYHIFWAPVPHIGRTVSGLLAGIVLVDLLAIAGGSAPITLIFVLLFATALLCQRFIPAT